MKCIGFITLPEQFSWTPHQLLTTIKEIDKKCPEEETPDARLPSSQTADNSDIMDNE
jgi:hypothetical protein